MKKPRSMKEQIDQYKKQIWKAGGKLPKGVSDDNKHSQIARLSSRLYRLTGKNN